MEAIYLAAREDRINEFLADPVLTVASVMLIVVSIGWVIVSRLILKHLRRAAMRGVRSPRVQAMRPSRDIWEMPP